MATSDELVLVLAPFGRDGELTASLLARFGFKPSVCATTSELVAQLDAASCAVITQEALDGELQVKLSHVLAHQPPWSDFPLIVLVNAQATAASQVLAADLGNVTVLERPLAPNILLTAVKAALRARRRQYEARAAIQQRDQFLAMLGHELRNPLGAIVMATQLLRQGVDRSQLEQRLDVIDRQSSLLARLVDDLLDVARVTTGKVRLRRESVNIDETIHSSMEALADRARSRGVPLVFSSTSGMVIDGDVVRIEQIINNLLSNAIKYSPAGRTVMISASRKADMCEIRVRDHGIGIAPEVQGRVFDLFAQADGSLQRADGGMGIGLTLVDRLVRLHGGTVELFSAGLGHGTELVVSLPIGKPAATNVIKMPVSATQLRVVLVEDNRDLRELTCDLLQTLGCSVELAIDGEDGLSRILASRPDVAFIDIGLPIRNGYDVAREVRKQLGTAIVLVAASGYGLEQDREQAHEAGFDLHVTKPLNTNVIGDALKFASAERARRTAQR